MYKFSIFIPAYNRVHTLERLLVSIENQTYKNFECIIVDDGSKDETANFIKEVRDNFSFPIIYVYQKNSGKHVARNKAIEIAKGKFFLTIDSDDILYPTTLMQMLNIWENEIPESDKLGYAGVEGLCVRMGDKKVLGDKFPEEIYHSDHLYTRFNLGVSGDKIRFIRTEVLKDNLFPVIEGEKFITESTVWNKIGKKYKTVYVNYKFAEVDYQNDGLTNNSLINRLKNPRGCRLYYKNFLSYISPTFRPEKKYIIRNCINYYRFSFHSRIPFKKQIKEIPLSNIYNLYIIIGYICYKQDKWKTRKKK
ncbi:glycosyltransferase family 2 protein [Oceanobacillus rekensis]|uniref:glycosyltransferase family 2 protein n=1 Tax=Oceanobacillus rekensis TaxID=937927 RepID=UPI000B442A9B|nr:glycosyltransferase family 2 protein [Oceanobacillus rekensis]